MSDADEVFDAQSRWRTEIVIDLGLDGDERCAGVSTSASMPTAAEPVLAHFADAPAGVIADVGGGLGPSADWLRRRQDRSVVLVEPSFTSCRMATELFAGLWTLCGAAASLPVHDRAVAGAMLNGVVSLIDDIAPVLSEARRILTRSGVLLVTDSVAADVDEHRSGPNVFRSVDHLEHAVRDAGFRVVEATNLDSGDGEWGDVQRRVDHEIEKRYGDDDDYAEWEDDRSRLHDLSSNGVIRSGSLVAVRE